MFNIEDSIATISSYVVGGAWGGLFRSPIGTAILITCVIMLIMVSMYQKGALVKTAFYTLLATTFIIFMHNRVLIAECSRAADSAWTDIVSHDTAMVTGRGDDIFHDMIVPDLRDVQ